MSTLTKLLKKEQKIIRKINHLNDRIDNFAFNETDYLENDVKLLKVDLGDIRDDLKDLLILELSRLVNNKT